MYLFSNFRAVFELFIFISKVSSFKTVKTGKDYLNFYQRFVDNFQVTDLTIFGFLLCSKIGFSPIIFLSKIRKVSHHSRLQLKNGSSKRNHRGLRTQLVALFCTLPNFKMFLTMCGWVGFPDAPAGAKLSSLSPPFALAGAELCSTIENVVAGIKSAEKSVALLEFSVLHRLHFWSFLFYTVQHYWNWRQKFF